MCRYLSVCFTNIFGGDFKYWGGGIAFYTIFPETADAAKENWQRLHSMYIVANRYIILRIIVYISKNACDRVIFHRLYNVYS